MAKVVINLPDATSQVYLHIEYFVDHDGEDRLATSCFRSFILVPGDCVNLYPCSDES